MKFVQSCESLICIFCLVSASLAAEPTLRLSSPDKKTQVLISLDDNHQLGYHIERDNKPVLERSRLGIVVDGQDLGKGVDLGTPIRREIDESYSRYGVKTRAVNHCLVYEIPIVHMEGKREWTLDVRIFDDGAGVRYRVPGTGHQQVLYETTTWQLPEGATAWYQTNTQNYEGVYKQAIPAEIPLTVDGQEGPQPVFIGCPVSVELPNGGYALLSEAGLYNYSGMSLRPTGTTVLEAVFQDDPNGFWVGGDILSPWRVTIITENLNELVNSDLIFNLCAPPDRKLFPDGPAEDWIKPGKGLITWCVFGNDGAAWHRQKWFVDMCAAMNCEYLLVDGGWRSERWGWLKDGGDLWARLDELCRYAADRNVGIFVWHAYPEGREDGPGLTNPDQRRAFLRRCKAAGAKGVKIDFFDSESKETIQAYEEILQETAEMQLMVNFHGANKPTGEVRTWPHEITREGIREQEYLLWGSLPLPHYAALPFSRMVAGSGDFLPAYVRPQYLKNTSAVFQLATAVIFTSPFICWPDHPEPYLESPFLPMIRTLPPVWDETCVLPESKIGETVAFARRSGTSWYVGVLNCTDRKKKMDLTLDFLGEGDYQANCYYDDAQSPKAVRLEAGKTVKQGHSYDIAIGSGCGFVGKFSKPTEYTK